ncbi:MAG TPA: DUF5979 domain-containing protein, partial [Acidimicrobiales bacterium]|nr:DUF5979 domain-containing protein [Acidimicrobiales bacterium]
MMARLGSVLLAVGTLLGVMAIPALAATPVPHANAPTEPVSRDLTSYVLFGFTSFAFKGANGPGHGIISGGNVGTNGDMGICQNGGVTMDDGTQLVGNAINATNTKCTIWDLFTNSLTGNPTLVPRNSGPNPVQVPVINPPALPSFACDPKNPFTVTKNQTGGLVPGTYGDVEFQDNTTVTLSNGTYTMCNLHTGQDVTVITGPLTVLQIAGAFTLSNGTVFGQNTGCAVPVYVRADGVKSNDNAINFAKNTHVFGHFLTPLGKIALGNSTDLHGAFWGDRIISDFDVDVTQCPPQTGEFPVTKQITGSGAGKQGQIEIQITCTPPNGSIPPFVIPPGATGSHSTVVTGITVPAVCHVTEVSDGSNDEVDVTVIGGGSGGGVGPSRELQEASQDVPVCPVIAPLSASRRGTKTEQGASLVNVVETTAGSTTTTTGGTTTTTGGGTTTESTTTTTGGSSTTGGETTTTTEPTTTTATTEPTTVTTAPTTAPTTTPTTAPTSTGGGSSSTGATTTAATTTAATTTAPTTTGATTTGATTTGATTTAGEG